MTKASGSFRDPNNGVFIKEGKVYRALRRESLADWQALRDSRFWNRSIENGWIIGTRELQAEEPRDLPEGFEEILVHEAVPFISYPYEWCFEMLRDAALLTLQINREGLVDGFITKDGSAFNVQWRKSTPVFIDVGSLSRWQPGQAWAGYQQFCQHFLNPLLVTYLRNIPFRPWLRGSLDGIETETAKSLLWPRFAATPGVFKDIFLHSLLLRASAGTKRSVRQELKSHSFGPEVVQANLRRLTKVIERLGLRAGSSGWSGYEEDNRYSDEDRGAKRDFVTRAIETCDPALVWDLGCNTGEYSRLAAEAGALVVAMDGDERAVARLYERTKSHAKGEILPLVIDLTDPSPDTGWRGRERLCLISRGRPDMIFFLALVHHLALTKSIPLDEIVGWLAETGTRVVFEFVHREDRMAQHLLRNKEERYEGYSLQRFRGLLNGRFVVEDEREICEGQRTLFLLRRVR